MQKRTRYRQGHQVQLQQLKPLVEIRWNMVCENLTVNVLGLMVHPS
jgi:hypothetical protein